MISVAQAKSILGIAQIDSAQDFYLTQLIAAAVAFLERMTGRYLGEPQAVTEVITGTGGDVVFLSDPPSALPVPTVSEATSIGATPAAILTAATDGWLLRGTKLVRKGGSAWTTAYEYTVTYTRGYAPESAPADIVQAVIALVMLWYKSNATGGMALTGETISGYSWSGGNSNADQLPPLVQQVIDTHRRPVLA